MLIDLHGRHVRPLGPSSAEPFVGRICERADLPAAARAREVLLLREPASAALPEGFRGYLLHHRPPSDLTRPDAYVLGKEMHYLAHGDVIRVDPRRHHISALYRRNSPSNSLLVTERCDNFCLMCSQPPKERDDSWIADELREVIPLMSRDTREIGLTGGEPGLLGERLVELIDMLERYLPGTAVHVLSNGRAFSNAQLTRSLAKVRHHDLMIGIPLYADVADEHDYVVQARGAFSETIRGILELKRARVRVEIRVVIHAETYKRLPALARFLTRNLLFVDHVALMGLELMGFGKTNVDLLWIDPLDYQRELVEAVQILDRAGMNVSIYNHQLCVLDAQLHPFSRRSISDWKNAFFDGCHTCARQNECGGFFASSTLRHSRGISPFNASTNDRAPRARGLTHGE